MRPDPAPRRPLPSSARFVLSLLALAALGAPVSIVVIHRQDAQAARINAEAQTGGSVDRGEQAVRRYGCDGCHALSRTKAASGLVGPPLTDFAARAEIAGKFANSPDNLVQWLRHPQQMVPGSGMPEQGMTETDARDLAAYLYTLRPLTD